MTQKVTAYKDLAGELHCDLAAANEGSAKFLIRKYAIRDQYGESYPFGGQWKALRDELNKLRDCIE